MKNSLSGAMLLKKKEKEQVKNDIIVVAVLLLYEFTFFHHGCRGSYNTYIFEPSCKRDGNSEGPSKPWSSGQYV